MLSVKQGGIKYYFLSLWYDSTWHWTQVSRAIGKHSNHYANVPLNVYNEDTFEFLSLSFFLSSSIPIVHSSWQVFETVSHVLTENV